MKFQFLQVKEEPPAIPQRHPLEERELESVIIEADTEEEARKLYKAMDDGTGDNLAHLFAKQGEG